MLILACQKEETEVINQFTVNRDFISQSSIYRSDTIDANIGFDNYSYYHFYEDSSLWGNVVPFVSVDFGRGYEALPHKYLLPDSGFVTLNYLHFYDQTWIFQEDRSPFDMGAIPISIAITYIPVE